METMFNSYLDALASGDLVTIVGTGLGVSGLFFALLMTLNRARTGSPHPAKVGVMDVEMTALGPAERRIASRRGGNPRDLLIDTNLAEPLQGWILNRSVGGLSVCCSQAVAVGSVIKVKPVGSVTAPWVEVEIKSCLPVGDQWQLGCAFLRTPPYSVLVLFG